LSNFSNLGYDCTQTQNISANLRNLGFGNIQGDYYWSSNNNENDNIFAVVQAYVIDTIAHIPQSQGFLYVRCVRAISY